MKINHGGIRDLFRYCLGYISSLSIVVYVIFSTITLFFPKEKYETINDIFMDKKMDKKAEIDTDGKAMLGYLGDSEDLESKGFPGIRRIQDRKGNKSSNFDLNGSENTIDDTNQSLQNGIIFFHQQDGIESNEVGSYGIGGGNPFDIEKIIADLHLQKEKRVAVVAKELGINWNKEKGDYAKLVGIEGNYNGSLDQNQKIRNYLIAHAQEIYKDKHGRNERDSLPLTAKEEKKIKMNTKEITGEMAYNNVTLKVSAPVESFPEGTVLKIKTLEDDDSTATFDIAFKEVVLMAQEDSVEYDAPMASFDISFYAPDDIEFLNELQPAEGKSVSVTFDYADNKEFKNSEDEGFLAIYHMEDNDNASVANLVSMQDSEKNNTKSDSMSIYANTLSVYILTVVSDLDKDVSENDRKIEFDAGTGGFIVENDDIILSSASTGISSVYTGKILSKDNEICLPDVKLESGNSFGGWYSENKFLGNAGTKFELRDDDNSEIYACVYSGEFTGNSCNLDEKLSEDGDSDLETLVESLDNEDSIIANNEYLPKEENKEYDEEIFDVYNWAINNGVTTIDNMDKAKLNAKITRAQLAKMMVVFMSGVLEKQPIITGEVNFRDVNSENLGDLAGYIELAYQYQIMGINADGTPIEDFNPNKTVTRAEFATVLSRVLYGSTYNQNGANYYEKHIEALGKANILSNTNPDLVEARGRIMTMLYNAQNNISNTGK